MQLLLVLSQVTLSKESMLITWVGLAKSGGGLRSRPEASPSTVGDSALGSSLTDGQTPLLTLCLPEEVRAQPAPHNCSSWFCFSGRSLAETVGLRTRSELLFPRPSGERWPRNPQNKKESALHDIPGPHLLATFTRPACPGSRRPVLGICVLVSLAFVAVVAAGCL